MKIKNSTRTIWPSNGQLINNTPLDNEWGITMTASADGTQVNYKVLAERFLDTYATSCLPSTQQTGSYDSKLLKADLEFLSNKLETVRKTITSWDAYHISQVVTTEEELQAGLSSLMENSSLLVNIPLATQINNKTYVMGDIVYCDLNRNQHIINSIPNGFYYPSSIQTDPDSNNVILQWNYSTATPIDNSNRPADSEPPLLTDNVLTTPYYEIAAALPYHEEKILYGIKKLLEPGEDVDYNIEFTERDGVKEYVFPEIYFYEAWGDSCGERYYLPSSAVIFSSINTTDPTDSPTVKIINPTTARLWVFVR